jgi:hypothetical protein
MVDNERIREVRALGYDARDGNAQHLLELQLALGNFSGAVSNSGFLFCRFFLQGVQSDRHLGSAKCPLPEPCLNRYDWFKMLMAIGNPYNGPFSIIRYQSGHFNP